MSQPDVVKSRALYQSFASLNDALKNILRTIPPHEEFVPPVVDYRRPAEFFVGREQFELEQRKLFRRAPVVVTVSALLKEPNSVMAHDGYGLPLLVTRDRDGKARVFLNACKHKGSLLVEDCAVHSRARVTCPYHSWTYALDGRLIGVPREESFCNLNRSTHGLTELPSQEVGGLIWAILDHKAAADFSILGPELRAELDGLDIADSHCYGRRTFELNANWKLVMEPFMEAYHVRRLHANTVGPMFKDVSGVHGSPDGYHLRQFSGRGDFDPAQLESLDNVHKQVTMTWQLMPSTVLIGSPYYFSVMVVIPQAPDRTRVDYHMLTRLPPDNQKAEELYAKSYEMILNVFGNEDFRAAEICHKGLQSGALAETVYGGMEEAIPRYYQILERHLQA